MNLIFHSINDINPLVVEFATSLPLNSTERAHVRFLGGIHPP